MSKYNLDTVDSFYTGTGETMLDALDGARIFSIKKATDKRFHIIEKCDDYFEAYLTKDELKDLGLELIALSEEQ